MKGTFAITDEREVAPVSADPTFGAIPGLESCRILSPEGYDLWLAVLEVAAGTALTWPEVHGEEGVYVLSGGLEVDGRACARGRRRHRRVRRTPSPPGRRQPSRLVHVGSRTAAPESTEAS